MSIFAMFSVEGDKTYTLCRSLNASVNIAPDGQNPIIATATQSTVVAGINDDGMIVGTSDVIPGRVTSFRWRVDNDGAPVGVARLIDHWPMDHNTTRTVVSAIDNNGLMIGTIAFGALRWK